MWHLLLSCSGMPAVDVELVATLESNFPPHVPPSGRNQVDRPFHEAGGGRGPVTRKTQEEVLTTANVTLTNVQTTLAIPKPPPLSNTQATSVSSSRPSSILILLSNTTECHTIISVEHCCCSSSQANKVTWHDHSKQQIGQP